ncbi:MAG: PQQ-dependent sugar dehydrogenase, partial [Acidobacteriota bacterium]
MIDYPHPRAAISPPESVGHQHAVQRGTLDEQQIWQIVNYIRTRGANLRGSRCSSPTRTTRSSSESGLGKIHRVNDGSSTPQDNPFVNTPHALPSIWSYGHRNPEGLSWDSAGLLWESEHGPTGGDESISEKGKNHGWGVISIGQQHGGTERSHEGMEQPIVYDTPTIAPSGIAFYAGSRLWPDEGGSKKNFNTARSVRLSRTRAVLIRIREHICRMGQPMHHKRIVLALVAAGVVGLAAAIAAQGTAKVPGNIWPPAKKQMEKAVALSPEDEAKTFSLPPGYHVELVASDPMIESPILMDFDPDGRLWVLEMLTFLPDTSGRDSREPLNRVSVLEDTNGDGKMDKKTVFADKLSMPRAMKVLDHGVLVGEPPNLWLMKDTDGDLKADTKDLVVNTYGNPNGGIEHNANSVFWAMDNVMYSSEHVWDLRLRNGKFEPLAALSRGQWQVSQDDAGRIYRNVNDSPLYVDYTPSRYFLRNPNGARTRGLYEVLIEQMDATVYPVRNNRGVNRGYRDPFFRADETSIVIQGAGTPTIYRGDAYPKDVRGNAFITDSPTNLVHRFVLTDDGSGRLKATNGFAQGEFLASSDERFRPVSLFDGPDGNLYVVDMYRGVVQAGGIWSTYLTDYIKGHDMELPVGKGRIWRVVYGNTPARRPVPPALSKATPGQLVQTLSNPRGWWRDTAQRLLVERGDASVAPALKTLAGSAPDWRTRLQALWTLDGLDAIDVASVQKAFADVNPDVRAAAVRLSERWLASDRAIGSAVIKLLDDKNWNVRRQVAASIGEMPAAERIEPATTVLTRYGADPIMVDAMISSLKGLEADVLGRVMQAKTTASAAPTEAVSMLAAAVAKSGDVAAVQRAIDVVADGSKPAWQRTALLKGLDA